MKKLYIIDKIIVFISIINLTTGIVYYVASGGKAFGKFSGYILSFASYPHNTFLGIKQVLSEGKFYNLDIDKNFKQVNELDEDYHCLTSYYIYEERKYKLTLFNLRSGDVLHEWQFSNVLPKELEITHPILLKDYSIVFRKEYFLVCLDSASNVLWKNEQIYTHHSIEFDHEGYIWSPAYGKGPPEYNQKFINLNGESLYYRDDGIAKFDPKTGEVIYSISISKILAENNQRGLIFGYMESDADPIHCNDIQPVVENSKYWKQGDLFISCRNIHTVFLYRPSTQKIIWMKNGYWVNQHDVDILDSTSIMVFNNNINFNYRRPKIWAKNYTFSKVSEDSLEYNQAVIYNFNIDSTYLLYPDLFHSEKINSATEGRSQLLNNGNLFIEESNEGKLFIGNNQSTIFRKQFSSPDSSYVYYTGWTRIYEDILAY